jgi:hypothetical protein
MTRARPKRGDRLSADTARPSGSQPPNVVFHRSTDPQEIINFIEDNFDLTENTGGYVGVGEG